MDPHARFSRWRGPLNRLLHVMARSLPGATSLRPALHRLRGVKIHGWAFIAEDVYLENEYPERIELHENVMIGLRTIIMAHFSGPGNVIICKDANITANCFISAHEGQTLTIGEGAFVAASSVVLKDVPPYTMVAGNPARPIALITVPYPRVRHLHYEDFRKGLRPLDSAKKG